jgi:hypothetical protein
VRIRVEHWTVCAALPLWMPTWPWQPNGETTAESSGDPAARRLPATLACNATFPTVPYASGAGSRLGVPVDKNDENELLQAKRGSLAASEPGNSCLGRCTVRTDQHVSMQSIQFGHARHTIVAPLLGTKWSGQNTNGVLDGATTGTTLSTTNVTPRSQPLRG